MTVTTFVFVRHGETAWNVEGRIQGHLDIPLNHLGVAQAEALGKRLVREQFDAVYSSDLVRAFHTARPTVSDPDRAIVKDQRLRERHLGALQGLTGEEAMAGQPVAWKAFKSRDPDLELAGGETLGEFSRRVVGFVETTLDKHAGGRILAVTHGGVLDAAYRHAAGMPLSASRNFPIYNASVNVISHDNGRWKIESWGDVSHLPQELAMDDS
ncbi:MAG TPA: histidine phosphatase family protein [Burkholderiales bacterium]|nr:histidine phosphatase family protein [Burkholderiales bacterium]